MQPHSPTPNVVPTPPAASLAHVPDPAIFLAGDSPAMQRLRAQLQHVSPHLRIALLIGEPGTGKEHIARALHRLAGRTVADDSFILLAHPSEIGDAAKRAQPGQTLFIPELTQLQPDHQRRLHQLLVRLEVARPGCRRPQLVFASTSDLRGRVSAGLFHADLYNRISSVAIHLPPLRSRPEDIPSILAMLLQPFTIDQVFDARARVRLQGHHWPGNIRELAHIAHCALQSTHPTLAAFEVPLTLSSDANATIVKDTAEAPPTERLDHVVQNHVLDVLVRCSGNKLRAAERLGISRSTLYRMLESSAPLDRGPT